MLAVRQVAAVGFNFKLGLDGARVLFVVLYFVVDIKPDPAVLAECGVNSVFTSVAFTFLISAVVIVIILFSLVSKGAEIHKIIRIGAADH